MQCCEINKVTLISNIKKTGDRLMPGVCYEQHLTVTSKGIVFFTAYKTSVNRLPTHGEERRFKIKEETSLDIIQVMSSKFDVPEKKRTLNDEHWKLYIAYSNGKEERYTGLMGDNRISDLSDTVRELLAMPELFLFDGKSVSPEYHFSEQSIKRIVEHADNEKRIINEKKVGSEKWQEANLLLCNFMKHYDDYSEYYIENDTPVSYVVEFNNGTKLQYPRGYGTMDDNIFDILSPYFWGIRIEDGKKQYGQYYI